MKIKPWGGVNWLLPKTQVEKWHLISSTSFEDRCTALVEWFKENNRIINSSTILKIENPPSEYWDEAVPIVLSKLDSLLEQLSSSSCQVLETRLLDPVLPILSSSTLNPDSMESVILDISTLPKRFFLFALKSLLQSSSVKNLVVTYARAGEYPESDLCGHALPPSALPGYARIDTLSVRPRTVVGVGYMSLSVDQLLDDARSSKLDYIFPFPPASPAYRRNWALMAMLAPSSMPEHTDIHRVHGMDAFEVFERVYSWGRETPLNLVPLGPKPHALGMAMAYLKLDSTAELIYSQPQVYRPNYSKGIAKDENGQSQILGYFLKRNGAWLF